MSKSIHVYSKLLNNPSCEKDPYGHLFIQTPFPGDPGAPCKRATRPPQAFNERCDINTYICICVLHAWTIIGLVFNRKDHWAILRIYIYIFIHRYLCVIYLFCMKTCCSINSVNRMNKSVFVCVPDVCRWPMLNFVRNPKPYFPANPGS